MCASLNVKPSDHAGVLLDSEHFYLLSPVKKVVSRVTHSSGTYSTPASRKRDRPILSPAQSWLVCQSLLTLSARGPT